MGLRINTNVASLAAQWQLSKSQRENAGAMKALASGNKFDNPSESSADFAIAERLRGQTNGMRSAQKNAESAYSMIQVAEGGLNEQNNMLIRMRELAIQAASDTFSDQEREMLNMEFQQLSQEFDRIAQTTSFGSNKLLNGTEKKYEFQVGSFKGEENVISYASATNTTAGELSLDSLQVLDKSDARDAIETLDSALDAIGMARANFAATQSRLDSTISNAAVQIENLEAARSQIADTDVAQAVSDIAKAQALQQYQLAVLAQANQLPGSSLKLVF